MLSDISLVFYLAVMFILIILLLNYAINYIVSKRMSVFDKRLECIELFLREENLREQFMIFKREVDKNEN